MGVDFVGEINEEKSWLEKAVRDYKVALLILDKHECFTDLICFHAQQAAEKALKGIAAYKGKEYGRTHYTDVAILKNDTLEDNELNQLRKRGEKLEKYINSRYPDSEIPFPTPDETREALGIAEEILRYVKKYLDM